MRRNEVDADQFEETCICSFAKQQPTQSDRLNRFLSTNKKAKLVEVSEMKAARHVSEKTLIIHFNRLWYLERDSSKPKMLQIISADLPDTCFSLEQRVGSVCYYSANIQPDPEVINLTEVSYSKLDLVSLDTRSGLCRRLLEDYKGPRVQSFISFTKNQLFFRTQESYCRYQPTSKTLREICKAHETDFCLVSGSAFYILSSTAGLSIRKLSWKLSGVKQAEYRGTDDLVGHSITNFEVINSALLVLLQAGACENDLRRCNLKLLAFDAKLKRGLKDRLEFTTVDRFCRQQKLLRLQVHGTDAVILLLATDCHRLLNLVTFLRRRLHSIPLRSTVLPDSTYWIEGVIRSRDQHLALIVRGEVQPLSQTIDHCGTFIKRITIKL